MTYRAPVRDLAFTLQAVAGIDRVAATGAFPDYDADLMGAVLEAAAQFVYRWRLYKQTQALTRVLLLHMYGPFYIYIQQGHLAGIPEALQFAFQRAVIFTFTQFKAVFT